MSFYESIYILRPDLTTEQVEKVTNRVEAILTANNGKILQTELWGRRQLAYDIKKNSKGYYVFHLLEGGGPMVANLEARLKIDEDVLKFQNVSVHKPHLGPSPLSPQENQRTEGEEETALPSSKEKEEEKKEEKREEKKEEKKEEEKEEDDTPSPGIRAD